MSEPPWAQIDEYEPDTLIHTAWEATPGFYLEAASNRDWVEWSEQLVDGMIRRGLTYALILGTCIEYAITGSRLKEDSTPLNPQSLYAKSKVELHERLSRRIETSPTQLAWARLFYPYGESEHPQRLCSSVVAQLKRGERVRLKNPLSVKDYIHVDDVARALVRITESRFEGSINVGTGEEVRIHDLARMIGEKMGCPELVAPPDPAVADPFYYVVADPTRLRRLGFFPQVSLEAGLQRLIEGRST